MRKPRHGQRAFIQARIINCLRAHEGGWVSTPEMIDYVWGTGEIEDPRNSLKVLVCRLRRRGFPIVSAKWRGYRYAPELLATDEIETAVAA